MARIFIVSLLFMNAIAFAEDIPTPVSQSSSGQGVINAPASGSVTRTGQSTVTVRIHNSCFGTNLRSISNPLAPSSIINAEFDLTIGSSTQHMKVSYPAELVTQAGLTGEDPKPVDASTYTLPAGSSAAIYGNIMQIVVPGGTSIIKADAGGVYTQDSRTNVRLKSPKFVQKVTQCGGPAVYGAYGHSSHNPTYNCGDFMGKDGPLSATLGGVNVASDNSAVEVFVSFPGQTGFCGGYWSPLMLFFDDARPTFNHTSPFPLNPMGETVWPEAGAPGYFLALDRNGNGIVDNRDELFGDQQKNPNGFEVLRQLDSNKDGVIDSKDKKFKDLVLWRDENGDGKCVKAELHSLASMGVQSISLNYKKGSVRPIGRNAEERESSTFMYMKKGEKKATEAAIVDVWFQPQQRP